MRARRGVAIAVLVVLALSVGLSHGAWAADKEPENLARRAKVSASDEYNGLYAARFAVDGAIPRPLSKHDDRAAWVVRGIKSKFQGWFRLEWDKPVDVAEIVYYGRTAQALEECFKDYEVTLDDSAKPIVRGRFKMTGDPQRIRFPKTTVKKVTLKFLSAHTSRYNPGASEIAVYSSSPSDEEISAFTVEKRTPTDQQLANDLYAGKFGFRDVLLIRRHPLDLSHVYTYHVEGYLPGGGLCVWTPGPGGGTLRQLIDSAEGEIIDCDLSYDGREVVFSWKRGGVQMARPNQLTEEVDRSHPDDNYQIYRVNIDGTGLTQLTDAPYNNLNACWLPDGGIAFISDRKPAYAYCFVTTSPVLYRMDRDGESQKRLSANYLMDFTPSVLNDGRIIYTRWEYVDRPACPIQSLWAIKPDGTGLSGFYGNRVLAPGTFMQAQPIPGTQKILALATNHNGDCRGAICIIDQSQGANARKSVRNVTPDVDMYRVRGVYGNGLNGPYETAFPIDDGRYFVSKLGVLQLRTFDGDRVSLLYPKDGIGSYSAQPIRATATPPVITPAHAIESDKLPEDGSVSGSWATVVLQDVYRGLAPHVKRGEVKQICVVQEIEKSVFTPLIHKVPSGTGYAANSAFGFQFPLVSCGATYSPKKVWGFADVAEDGSASFQVPSEVPIYFMALDAEGQAVQRMRTFTHMMPGEVQGCVGCHADRNEMSPHAVSDFVSLQQTQELRPPEWGVKGFSYPEVVQPVFDKHCVECHNASQQDGGVDLSADKTDFFNVSYDVLARKGTQGENSPQLHNVLLDSGNEGRNPFTSWIWTINGTERNILQITPKQWGSPASKLAELIRSGHPDAAGKPRVSVPPEERRRVYLWIDLNVPYYGTSASNHRERMGCRRMLPPELKPVLDEVAGRRCNACHTSGVPRTFYTRMLKPEKNNFLLAPLAKSAGGTEACGRPIFSSKEDPDYRKILAVFRPIQELLKEQPRADMDGFVCPPCHTPMPHKTKREKHAVFQNRSRRSLGCFCCTLAPQPSGGGREKTGLETTHGR